MLSEVEAQAQGERMRASRGFTLIEILVVTAIALMLLTAMVVGFHSIARTDLRTTSSKLAGAVRYCFDRAITTGGYYRLVLDLDANRYYAERADDHFYLIREKERTAGKGRAYDADEADRLARIAEQKRRDEQSSLKGSAALLLPPPKAKRARFDKFKDAALPKVQLSGKPPYQKGVRLFDVYTARQPEPYISGKAYLYFFPDGHTERAVIRLASGDDFYWLMVSPLTGRVEVMSGDDVRRVKNFEDPRRFVEEEQVMPSP